MKDIFTDNGFKQILNTPTRVTDQIASLIDLIFVNDYQNIRYKTKYESETIRYRDQKNYDVNVINSELLNINWDGVYNSNSLNQSLNVMKFILKDTIDRHAPFVIKRVKGKKSPWMPKKSSVYEHT